MDATAVTVAPVDVGEITGAITGMMGNFSSSNLLIVLAAALGVSVALVLCWFGYNWITRKVSGALKKGKL